MCVSGCVCGGVCGGVRVCVVVCVDPRGWRKSITTALFQNHTQFLEIFCLIEIKKDLLITFFNHMILISVLFC